MFLSDLFRSQGGECGKSVSIFPGKDSRLLYFFGLEGQRDQGQHDRVLITVDLAPGGPASSPTSISFLLPGIPAARFPFETLMPDLPIYTGFS